MSLDNTPRNPPLQGVRPNETSNLPTSNAFGKSNTGVSFSTKVGGKDLDVVVDAIEVQESPINVTLKNFLSVNKKRPTAPVQHSGYSIPS